MNDAGETMSTEPQPQQTQATTQQPAPVPFVLQYHLFFSMPLAVFALILIVRAMPFSAKQLNSKPLSCDACMAFWCSVAVGVGLAWLASTHWSWALLHMLPAPGVAMLLAAVHKWLVAPRELPLPPGPMFPDEPLRKRK